jgi:membrane protease YdiL (CAAX protease family)
MSDSYNPDSQSSSEPAAILSDRALASWEMISVVSSIFIAEWMLAAAAGLTKTIVVIPVGLAVTVMLYSHRLRGERARDLGFRFDNFLRALVYLILPMAAALVILIAVGWRLGARLDFLRWQSDRNLAWQLVLGTIWGLVQQYALQGFLNRRAMLVIGSGWPSILVVAAIFGCLHLPNLWLAALTFAGGLVWATVYQKAPNLFALALSHSLMTWLIVSTLPMSALNHLRIGFKYFG